MKLRLSDLETLALVVERAKLDRNFECMRNDIHALGGVLRPHAKTVNSIDLVHRGLVGEPRGH